MRQKRQLKPKSWRSLDRKSMDEAFVRRTNRNAAEPISSPPQPSLLSTEYSLMSFCECGNNSPIRSPPHSLSMMFDSRSRTLQDLCHGPDDSSRFILVSRSGTFLPPNMSVNALYKMASTSQLDLLEALALEPVKNAGETLYQDSLTMSRPKSGGISKDIEHLICKADLAFKVSESALFSTMGTGQQFQTNQDETNPIAKKMSPRIEPRRRYQTHIPTTFIVSQPGSILSQSFGKQRQHKEQRRQREQHSRGLNLMDELPTSSNPLPVRDEMQRASLAASSRDRFPRKAMDRRAESDDITHLSVESLGDSNLKPSSETYRSTASRSIASTLLEPFHLDEPSVKQTSHSFIHAPEIAVWNIGG
jgi:hypothetical protein